MKTPTALSVTSSQREQTSLRSQVPRLPRSNVCSTRDLENRSASVHRKRFSTPSLTLKFLCAGKLNPRFVSTFTRYGMNAPQRILRAIGDEFDLEIVSEYEPKYWGYETQE